MGANCHINAHFPVAEFTAEEQAFLAELRTRLPRDDAWLALPWEERQRRQRALHQQLAIPGNADDWQFVEQWQKDGTWYVTDLVPHALCPPFPRALAEYHPAYNSCGLTSVWRVAFSAPGSWQSKYWHLCQTLSETRRHVRDLFGKLWGIFSLTEYHHEYTDAHDLRAIRQKAPPGSVGHKRLRGVFSLFRLRDFVSLHRDVLSQDLPSGTVLELDILGDFYSGTEDEAKAMFDSGDELRVLDAVEAMDLDALINNKLLAQLSDYDEDVTPWLDAANAWCESSIYLLESE
jgi:hypothetical protein